MSDPYSPTDPQNETPKSMAEEIHEGIQTGVDQMRQGIQASRRRRNSGWIIGLILVLAGGLLLLQNLTNFRLDNWWALFILIPSFGSFADAWNRYQDDGRFSRHVRNAIIGGIIFLFIALFFLFNLAMGNYWPYLLIFGGIVILLNAFLPE